MLLPFVSSKDVYLILVSYLTSKLASIPDCQHTTKIFFDCNTFSQLTLITCGKLVVNAMLFYDENKY